MTNKTEKIDLRLTSFDKNRIQWLADKYAGGNVSRYILFHALNAPRIKINKKKALNK